MNKQCDWCCKKLDGHVHSYYLSPFNEEPYEFELCDECNESVEYNGYEGVSYCEWCDREIANNIGYRLNMRYDDNSGGMVCVRCLQEEWLKNGMPCFKDGDFFDDPDLVEAGYEKHRYYFCRSKESYKEAEEEFKRLQEEGYLVILSIEASGMGLEHHIRIWKKERE